MAKRLRDRCSFAPKPDHSVAPAPHKYKLEVSGIGLDFAPVWYPAKIGRWHSSFRGSEKPDGYHPVTYDDGGKLLVHESSFRVVDNRPLR